MKGKRRGPKELDMSLDGQLLFYLMKAKLKSSSSNTLTSFYSSQEWGIQRYSYFRNRKGNDISYENGQHRHGKRIIVVCFDLVEEFLLQMLGVEVERIVKDRLVLFVVDV